MEQYLSVKGNEILDVLNDYAHCTEGLKIQVSDKITIAQSDDAKTISLSLSDIEEVLVRKDQDEKIFLQLNLNIGTKALLTNNWIGFKPVVEDDMLEHVPRVVTTPDLLSVFEALEESKRFGLLDEANTLRQVYMAIIQGGERIGFDMSEERLWIQRLGLSTAMSA